MADVTSTLASWSSLTNNNNPQGTVTIGNGADDNFRELQGVIVRGLSHKGSDIAATSTTDLGAVEGLMHDITGTSTISSFGTVRQGILKIVKFEGQLTLTHHATSLILPGGGNIITADGDVAIFISEGSGNWRCISYQYATNGQIPAGAIMPFATTALPAGWLVCAGQAVERSIYARLFAAIGTTYGVGDGSSTFNLPDLRGRVVAGKDDMGGSSANRMAGLLSGIPNGDVLGATGGTEAHTLTAAESGLPAHVHAQQGDPNGANQDGDISTLPGNPTVLRVPLILDRSDSLANQAAGGGGQNTASVSAAAASDAHINVQPTIILHYFIKT